MCRPQLEFVRPHPLANGCPFTNCHLAPALGTPTTAAMLVPFISHRPVARWLCGVLAKCDCILARDAETQKKPRRCGLTDTPAWGAFSPALAPGRNSISPRCCRAVTDSGHAES